MFKWNSRSARDIKKAKRQFVKLRAEFYEDLAVARIDNETTYHYISERLARGIKQGDPLTPLYSLWLKRMDKNEGKISYFLEGSVPPSDILFLSTIETTAEFNESLKFLSLTIREREKLKRTAMKAILMPVVTFAVIIIYFLVQSFFTMPLFEQISPPEKWNAVGRLMYAMSYTVRTFGLVIAGIGYGAYRWFKWSLDNWTGVRRARVDKWCLPYRLYRDYNGTMFLLSLAMLMQSGELTIVHALEMTKQRATPWLRWHIARILKRIDASSGNYGEAFATGVFSQEITNRLDDYSRRSGSLSGALKKVGIDGMNKVRDAIDDSVSRMNVVLLLILGAVIGFMVLGTFLTGQGMTQGLREQVKNQRFSR